MKSFTAEVMCIKEAYSLYYVYFYLESHAHINLYSLHKDSGHGLNTCISSAFNKVCAKEF